MVTDLRFHDLRSAKPIKLMCVNCREGGLTKTYGDGEVAGCTQCGSKFMQKDLERWNDEQLVALQMRGTEPTGGPFKEWWDAMQARRAQRVAAQLRENEQRERAEIEAARLRNRTSGGAPTAA